MTFTEARKKVADAIGLPESFDGSLSAFNKLDPETRVQLANDVCRFIVANPAEFEAEEIAFAKPIVDAGGLNNLQPREFRFIK